MKYEMIFGDESLFDGAPDDAEYAGWFCQEIRWYMILNGKILFSDGGTWCTSDNPYLSADIAAMRRVIKEPKRWTWEDKKAGRLPEVGAAVSCDGAVTIFHGCNIQNHHKWHVEYGSGDLECVDAVYCKPIETPAEKAQREEDEFVTSLCKELDGTSLQHDSIYERGVRAAYRKLKGGE